MICNNYNSCVIKPLDTDDRKGEHGQLSEEVAHAKLCQVTLKIIAGLKVESAIKKLFWFCRSYFNLLRIVCGIFSIEISWSEKEEHARPGEEAHQVLRAEHRCQAS